MYLYIYFVFHPSATDYSLYIFYSCFAHAHYKYPYIHIAENGNKQTYNKRTNIYYVSKISYLHALTKKHSKKQYWYVNRFLARLFKCGTTNWILTNGLTLWKNREAKQVASNFNLTSFWRASQPSKTSNFFGTFWHSDIQSFMKLKRIRFCAREAKKSTRPSGFFYFLLANIRPGSTKNVLQSFFVYNDHNFNWIFYFYKICSRVDFFLFDHFLDPAGAQKRIF